MKFEDIEVGQTVRFQRPEDKKPLTGVVRERYWIRGAVGIEVPPTRGLLTVSVTFVEAVVSPAAPRLIECKKSQYHGFHADNLDCPMCPTWEPPKTQPSPEDKVKMLDTAFWATLGVLPHVGQDPAQPSSSYVANVIAGLGGTYYERFIGLSIVLQATFKGARWSEPASLSNIYTKRLEILNEVRKAAGVTP